MIVMKFGGTSVGDAERIRVVARLVAERRERRPLVVVSAHGRSPGPRGEARLGVTDILIKAARLALAGDPLSGFSEVQDRHYEIAEGLGLDKSLIAEELAELNELLRGICLVKELTLRTLDYAMSFGERMSSKVVAAHMRREGLEAAAVAAYDIGFLTDSRFGSARPLPQSAEAIARAVSARADEILVVTGFVGKNAAGEITTIGRGGSDFTASYIGAAVGAEEVQIWSDVDGVLTADPSVVPGARPIDRMSFREAAEVAYYGAQVLHPATMLPAMRRNIPVRVLNTFHPEGSGTLILPKLEAGEHRVKAIVYREDITLINIESTRMLGQVGFMARLFDVFKKYDVVIDMIATSEVSLSLTTDRKEGVEAAAEELRTSEVAEVSVEPGKALVCVVGSGMKRAVGMAARVFGAVARARVNIQVISQGANEINIAFLVSNEDIEPAVRALHDEFFGEER